MINSAHDLAPRVSFAYGIPRGGGKSTTTVVRGGYGIFYDRFALSDFLTTQQLNGKAQIKATYINPGISCTPDNPLGCGTTTTSRPTTYALGDGILGGLVRSSYTLQSAIGVDQQLGRAATVSVNYLNARGVHQYMTRNFFNPTDINYQFQSGGVYHENQLFVNMNARLQKVSLFGFYALSFANANTSGSGFFPTSTTDTRVDYGRSTFAKTNMGVLGGSLQLPYKFMASPFMIAQSGTPYNLTTGLDPLGSSIYNQRPYFVNGDRGGCRVASDFSSTQTGSLTPVPINYCAGPANFTLNLRLARTFGFGPKTEVAGGGGQGGNRGGPGRGGPGGGGRGPGGPGGPGGGPMGMGGNSGHRYSVTLMYST